jgi:ribose 1,5-bisphosphokinase PhnN
MSNQNQNNGLCILVCGSAGAGKSFLLQHVEEWGGGQVKILSKYATRPARVGDGTEIICVADLPKDCDFRYRFDDREDGPEYGIKSADIEQCLESGESCCMVVSNFNTINDLRAKYGSMAKAVWIDRDISFEDLLHIQRSRSCSADSFDEGVSKSRLRILTEMRGRYEANRKLFDLALSNNGSVAWLVSQMQVFFSSIKIGVEDTLWLPTSQTAECSVDMEIAFRNANAAFKRELARDPDLLYTLSPRRFEEFVASLFEDLGYEDVSLTPRSRDGGYDIFAMRNDAFGPLIYLVECKRYAPSRKVSVEVVRALHGVQQQQSANIGIVVATSTFSRDASKFARNVGFPLSLRDGDDLREILSRYQ